MKSARTLTVNGSGNEESIADEDQAVAPPITAPAWPPSGGKMTAEVGGSPLSATAVKETTVGVKVGNLAWLHPLWLAGFHRKRPRMWL